MRNVRTTIITVLTGLAITTGITGAPVAVGASSGNDAVLTAPAAGGTGTGDGPSSDTPWPGTSPAPAPAVA